MTALVDPDELCDAQQRQPASSDWAAPRGVSTYSTRYPDFPVPMIRRGRCVLWLAPADIEVWRAPVRRATMTSAPGLRHAIGDLQAMAEEHVNYEVSMAFVLARPWRVYEDLLIGVAVLESYLLHVRNVHEFLTTPRRPAFPFDVVGADYFDRPWKGSCLEPAEKQQIDRRLAAHLTLQRLQSNQAGGRYNWASPGGDRTLARVEGDAGVRAVCRRPRRTAC